MANKRGRKALNGKHKLKALSEYLKEESHVEFATKIGISKMHLSNLLFGRRRPSVEVCNSIIQETDGEVGYKDLRLDIYNSVMAHVEKNKDD